MSVMMSKEKTMNTMMMTTSPRPEDLPRATLKRSKHPARSARILTTGISFAAILGLASGISIVEADELVPDVNDPTEPAAGGSEQIMQSLVRPSATIWPSAAVAPQVLENGAVSTNQNFGAVDASGQAGIKRERIQIQVSTTSSGSK